MPTSTGHFRTGPFAGRTVAALGQDLRAGRATATELAGQALDAVAGLDAALNAFVTVDAGGALAAARRADDELAGGTDRGPLHGIPVGVKDLIMVAGLPATMGSRHFAGHVPDRDAACVTLLREAGAVIVGKTTTHEFAYGPTGDRSATGPSRNPWDPARMSGGSSGGSAAAVAAGMVPLALGTDTGGSVRIPSALCGIAGFKPAYDAIPADGVFPLSRTFDHVGVLAGDARDCLLAYRCLAARDAGEPPGTPVPRHVQGPAGPSGREDGGQARVAWLDPGGLFAGAARVVRSARAASGAEEEVKLAADLGRELRDTYTVIQSCEAVAEHAERLAGAPDLFDPELLDRLRAAAEVPGWRYVRAMAARERLARAAGELFGRHDVLALPAVPITAPLIDQRETELDGEKIAVRAALLAYTSPWNVLGLPALTVPAGTVDGLPVGLQLVGRPGREALLFEVAARLPLP
ncbi:amidase [Nonomuraea longispora]|uniref:Amidase n=1 Tax=Nonomuraea longispora TaxID=1848320 RepID=A0A4R4N1E6_9ACTN|nr:amidase [Nonomuraea longispora]TDC00863.1 amidase [Nonomuraea longispora]